MKPFRKQVAIAIDGGGIRGLIPARALSVLENHLGQPSREIFQLAAGTSTGAIISAGIGAGLTGVALHRLYTELGGAVFCKSWRTWLWPLTRYRYPHEPLESALRRYIGEITMGDFWSAEPPIDVIITAFDLVENRTRFIKSWKEEYAPWPVVLAVLASSSVPTFFPVVDGRYVDGGVGSYANPCYLAAYEASLVVGWEPAETTLVSLGTGRNPHTLEPGDADQFRAWHWIGPVLDAFVQSATEQQVHLVGTFFDRLDFRRFQVDLSEPIAMDEVSRIPELTAYGDEMGRKILNDEADRTLEIKTPWAPRRWEMNER